VRAVGERSGCLRREEGGARKGTMEEMLLDFILLFVLRLDSELLLERFIDFDLRIP
jgi:hypothetical protein